MKIVFVSNYYNHHQAALCAAFAKQENVQFSFVATSDMRAERKAMGYDQLSIPNYVYAWHHGGEEQQLCEKMILEADVVITGAAPERLLKERIKAGKPIFRYSERPFKKKLSLYRYIKHFVGMRLKNPMRKPIYMLCASAYTARDYRKVGLFRNKTYKWGYFPEVIRYNSIENLLQEKDPRMLLWAGRMLGWKHPEHAILVAAKLKTSGYRFHLNMIGAGEMQPKLEQMIQELDLSDYVTLLGVMNPEQVRHYMEKAGIYLFTSDRQEGWGAVLNESMNSGCAVVASHAIGSVPYLIEDGKNGIIYPSGNVDVMYEKVKYLLDYEQQQQRLGKAAYRTMTQLWNADVAAKRVIQLADMITNNKMTFNIYVEGPCSCD